MGGWLGQINKFMCYLYQMLGVSTWNLIMLRENSPQVVFTGAEEVWQR